jgi:hypothetical protein
MVRSRGWIEAGRDRAGKGEVEVVAQTRFRAVPLDRTWNRRPWQLRIVKSERYLHLLTTPIYCMCRRIYYRAPQMSVATHVYEVLIYGTVS